jgi:DNA-binding NarL/FixJ family response regulator
MDRLGTIVVVDPDELTRAAVHSTADRHSYEVVTFDNGEALLEGLADRRPVLAVVEVDLAAEKTGFEVLSELRDEFGAGLLVMLVSGQRTAPHDRVAGLLLGADDYVLKPFDLAEFRARVHRLLMRSTAQMAQLQEPGETVKLSPRERQVLTLLAAGNSQDEIAQELYISPKTVATHLQHVLVKLNVHSRAQAVAVAYRRRILTPSADADRRG